MWPKSGQPASPRGLLRSARGPGAPGGKASTREGERWTTSAGWRIAGDGGVAYRDSQAAAYLQVVQIAPTFGALRRLEFLALGLVPCSQARQDDGMSGLAAITDFLDECLEVGELDGTGNQRIADYESGRSVDAEALGERHVALEGLIDLG